MSRRFFTLVGKTVYATAPTKEEANRGNMTHGDFPPDLQCVWSEHSVLLCRTRSKSDPYVGFSFVESEEAARADFETLLSLIHGSPVVDPLDEVQKALERIKAMPLSPLDRRQPMSRLDRASALRAFLQSQSITSISVTTPAFAGASCVDISFPNSPAADRHQKREQAATLLNEIVDQLFPANRNRPDPGSDYYGYLAWSVK